MKHSKISGIIPPLVTPLTSKLELDDQALGGIIEHVLSGGASGIFILGSTGEGPSLGFQNQQHVIKTGVKSASGRLPVFVNISADSLNEVFRNLDFASTSGADYAVLAPPHYYDMSQGELKRFFNTVADQSPIPILLYNAPQYFKTEIEPDLVFDLSLHESIIGLKDSSGKREYIKELVNQRKDKDFSLLVGPELLLGESVLIGCDGGICGGANLYPQMYTDVYSAAKSRDQNQLEKIQILMEKINRDLYGVAESPMGIIIGLKYLLSCKGLGSSQMAMPIYELSDAQKQIMETLNKEISSCGY